MSEKWRILEVGEISQDGDEYEHGNGWEPCERGGFRVTPYMKYRRLRSREQDAFEAQRLFDRYLIGGKECE